MGAVAKGLQIGENMQQEQSNILDRQELAEYVDFMLDFHNVTRDDVRDYIEFCEEHLADS